jgi:hypothetical protein
MELNHLPIIEFASHRFSTQLWLQRRISGRSRNEVETITQFNETCSRGALIGDWLMLAGFAAQRRHIG